MLNLPMDENELEFREKIGLLELEVA